MGIDCVDYVIMELLFYMPWQGRHVLPVDQYDLRRFGFEPVVADSTHVCTMIMLKSRKYRPHMAGEQVHRGIDRKQFEKAGLSLLFENVAAREA